MKQFSYKLTVATKGKGLYEFTREVESWLAGCNVQTGLLTVFIQHTSASLIIQENADPDVIFDLNNFFARLVPERPELAGRGYPSVYRHTAEGPDDMPAHIRAALTATQVSIPVADGRLALGTWQGIYVFEHRTHPHRRSVALHLVGE